MVGCTNLNLGQRHGVEFSSGEVRAINMRVETIAACLLAATNVCGFAHLPASRVPHTAPRPRLVVLSAAPGDEAATTVAATTSTDLVAAAQQSDGRRVAMSGLQPQGQGQQQQYAGVPPPETTAPSPTFLQKARGPFMGLTLLATAAVAAWQSNRLYNRRQSALLDDFGATMVFHLGDQQEMSTALKSFRSQLGPGPYTGRMFTSFLKSMATDVPIGVTAVKNLKAAVALFRLSDAAAAKLLDQAATELERQPSVLGACSLAVTRRLCGDCNSALR